MSSASTALVIGEALIDIVRSDGDPTHHPGGSCANVAVALARLGRRTELATRYGDDHLGDILEAHLTGSGVEIRPGSRPRARHRRARRRGALLPRLTRASLSTELELVGRPHLDPTSTAVRAEHVRE